ncbi:DUF4377 domain-containing protein [Chitinophaga sp. Mgbs1]|uniref:DUF4377 domain-containing protein n=1 Tax=Chitinophaga solisilvae TaxID=1233460 RepID=A0A3S1D0A5_9BACT|nr:DUF4377 domain-containing protein [Chitinophaga solisilvae]
MFFELAFSLATAFITPVQKKQPPKNQTIYVKETKEPCTGVAPMQCLQIKGLKDSAWQNLYTNIEGFNYTPGYRYKLLIRVTPVKNPPADGSSLKYTLRKVLEKKKIAEQGTEQTIYVKESKEPCTGVAPMECLQIRDQKDSSWQNLYTSIEGFNYVPGYRYKLLIGITPVKNPPADAPSVKYTLKKVLEKKKIAGANADKGNIWNYISGKRWNVIQIDGKTLTQSGIWLEFDPATGRFHGKGGCNSISGGYKTSGDVISFSAAISTKMACMDTEVMRREAAFLHMISDKTFRYDVADQTLNLYDNNRLVLMFGMQSKEDRK